MNNVLQENIADYTIESLQECESRLIKIQGTGARFPIYLGYQHLMEFDIGDKKCY